MTRVLLAVGGFVLVLVAAIAAYLTFADLGRFRPEVEAAVSKAVGREFRIAGDFEPKVLPRLSFVATDVTLANADWGAPTPMISIGSASAEIGLWSLLFGPIKIKSLELNDVTVLLEQDASGARNWAGAPATPAAPDANTEWQGLPVIIELASVGNVSAIWRQPGADDFPAALAMLSLRTDERRTIVVEANGQVREVPFAVNGSITKVDANRARVELDGSIAEATVRAGALASLQQVDFDVSLTQLDRLGEAFSIAGLPAGALELAGSLFLGADRYELRDATAKIAGAETTIQAVIPQDSGTPIDLEVAISVPNLAQLDAGLPAVALIGTATAQVSPERIRLDPLTVEIGESDFSGSVEAEIGEVVSLVIKGESKRIDLTPLRSAVEPVASAEPVEPVEPTQDEPATQWVFGEEALPLEQIAAAAVEAEISVGELRSRDMEIRNVTLVLEDDGETLRLKTRFDVTDGGSAEGNAVLSVADGQIDLGIDFDASDLRLNIASGDVEDPAQIPPVGLSASLRSSGASPRALASAANGHVVFTQGTGRIANDAVGMASGDILAQIFSALNPFAKSEEYTNWNCTVVRLDVTDGVGTLEPMLAQADKLLIQGSGEIDLRTEKLDIEFNTKPRTGVGLTADMFVTPFVKISGTLAKPGVGLNASGTVLSGGAAVLTGGVSLLVQGVTDRATGERDQCAKALAEAGGPASARSN